MFKTLCNDTTTSYRTSHGAKMKDILAYPSLYYITAELQEFAMCEATFMAAFN